jgi:hypothetical protein
MQIYNDKSVYAVLVRLGILAFAMNYYVQANAEPFDNLDFESAVIGTPVLFQLPAAEALPCWDNDHYQAGYVIYDTIATGSTAISVHDSRSTLMRPLQGLFSVTLQSGALHGSFQDAWISQTGDVPSDARSLTFESDFITTGGSIVVSLNGIQIPMSLYSVGPVVNANWGPVKTYIGDISAFAGQQDVTLRLEAVPPAGGQSCNTDLDAIKFSMIPAPEPSTLLLSAIGALITCAYRLRRRAAAE